MDCLGLPEIRRQPQVGLSYISVWKDQSCSAGKDKGFRIYTDMGVNIPCTRTCNYCCCLALGDTFAENVIFFPLENAKLLIIESFQ